MSAQIDTSLLWTEHYIEYGFAVIPQVAETQWLEAALEEVTGLLDTDLPLCEWSATTVPALKGHSLHLPFEAERMSVLPSVYDQPGVRAAIGTMFGSPDLWSDDRLFQVFVSSFNPHAGPAPCPHIDFVDCPIPILGSGFMFQLSLLDSEPDSGNILIYPGTHKTVLQALIENPDRRYPQDLQPLLEVESYEFVAKAGDMLLFHHLVGHGSSFNHAAHRTPRVVLHGQGTRNEWLTAVDAAQPDLTPWERSLAVAGSYHDRRNEKQVMLDYYRNRKAA